MVDLLYMCKYIGIPRWVKVGNSGTTRGHTNSLVPRKVCFGRGVVEVRSRTAAWMLSQLDTNIIRESNASKPFAT